MWCEPVEEGYPPPVHCICFLTCEALWFELVFKSCQVWNTIVKYRNKYSKHYNVTLINMNDICFNFCYIPVSTVSILCETLLAFSSEAIFCHISSGFCCKFKCKSPCLQLYYFFKIRLNGFFAYSSLDPYAFLVNSFSLINKYHEY